ncbi:hypothetical protein [uncultured Bacteroides sp.]|nr:hypothetical protein [uncultured Bacteroides sp.]
MKNKQTFLGADYSQQHYRLQWAALPTIVSSGADYSQHQNTPI